MTHQSWEGPGTPVLQRPVLKAFLFQSTHKETQKVERESLVYLWSRLEGDQKDSFSFSFCKQRNGGLGWGRALLNLGLGPCWDMLFDPSARSSQETVSWGGFHMTGTRSCCATGLGHGEWKLRDAGGGGDVVGWREEFVSRKAWESVCLSTHSVC